MISMSRLFMARHSLEIGPGLYPARKAAAIARGAAFLSAPSKGAAIATPDRGGDDERKLRESDLQRLPGGLPGGPARTAFGAAHRLRPVRALLHLRKIRLGIL